ncbi:SHOCT domain-containing protein [Nocardia sp. GTS18]
MVAELTKLSELHQAGALSDAEFASAKTKLLG